MTTLLQRHRLMLQARHSSLSICTDHENLDSHSLFDHQSLHGTLQSDHTGAYSVVSSGNCSSAAPKTRRRCNSSGYGKRKSEIDVEEQEEEEETGEEKSEITIKAERETSSCKYRFKGSEVQKQNQSDVIHVRARRGQATDSHSLAERARREKISKKMKCLQDLVPGCDRVTGKAGMLDEIINYVQSLQKQVEFLSMKLVSVNHRLDFSGDNMLLKEAPASYAGCFPSAASTAVTQFEPANPSSLHYNLMQHHGSSTTISIDQSQSMPEKSSLPIPEALLESSFSQMPSWELDWQSLLNPGFQ